jgi:signal transduction histidine kinase
MRILVSLLLLVILRPALAQPDTVTFESGELLISDSALPPAESAGWQRVALPDQWPNERYAAGDNGWYRFTLNIPVPQAPWGIYLPRLCMNAAIYFNGQLLGDGGSFADPLGRNWSRPLYVTVPGSLWREGANTIDIRLKSYFGYGLLDQVMAGPDAVLKKQFEFRNFWKSGLANALFLVLAAISIFMLNIWRQRRHDSVYFWFALTTLSWAILALNIFLTEIPVAGKTWDSLIYSDIAWWTVCAAIFCHRFAELRRPILETAYALWAGASTVSYLTSDAHSLPAAVAFWQMGSPIIGFIIILTLFRAWRRGRSAAVGALTVGMTLIQLAGIYSYLFQSLTLPSQLQIIDHLIELASPILLILIAWHLASRFVNALNESEALNSELEARVAARTWELEQSHQRLRELEKQQAVTQERERIHRDLHDDVGAKLLTLTYRAADDDSAELARSALQDLRDVVSHSSHTSLDLSAALANWRAECADRIDAAGLTLTWRQPDVLPSRELLPQQTMNVGRILREVISNALRHSKAANILVDIEEKDETISITIENDGHDCDVSRWGSGRGTRNMKARAELLGGEIGWERRAPGGCRILWRFPLHLPEATLSS